MAPNIFFGKLFILHLCTKMYAYIIFSRKKILDFFHRVENQLLCTRIVTGSSQLLEKFKSKTSLESQLQQLTKHIMIFSGFTL